MMKYAAPVVALFILAWSAFFQPPLVVPDGFDGTIYADMAAQCAAGGHITAPAPFVYRVGVPCLVAVVPARVLNGAAAVLFALLLDRWLRRFLDARTALVLTSATLAHWLGPLRFGVAYGAITDTLFMTMFVAALLVLEDGPPWAFVLLCMAGALIRESVLVLPLAALLYRPRRAVLALIACAAVIAAIRLSVTPTGAYAFGSTALAWLWGKPSHRYLLGWLLVYGPALALWRGTLKPHHAALVGMIAVLAYVGGSDTERILFWAAPLVLIAIGRGLDCARPVLIIGTLLVTRFLVPTPADPQSWVAQSAQFTPHPWAWLALLGGMAVLVRRSIPWHLSTRSHSTK